jgi:3-dehydroquinate dehydratase-2
MAEKRVASRANAAISKPGAVQVLVLSGPNLDRLGRREPEIYGRTTLADIHAGLAEQAAQRGARVDCRQTNHEGLLVDWIGAAKDDGFDGILINAGAFTHTSYALHDAIKGCELPAVELHISNPDAREPFRHVSCIAAACKARVAGFGPASYGLALDGLLALLPLRGRPGVVGGGAGRAKSGGRGPRRSPRRTA